MDPYDGFDIDLAAEAPCEFCGEMWPLPFLTEHQSTHLVDPHYYIDNLLDTNEAENVVAEEISAMKSEPQVITEKLLQSPAPVQAANSVTKPSSPVKAANSNTKPSSPVKQPDHEVKKLKTEKIREFTTESGEKTIVYGTDIDHEKDFEDAKCYKVPLLNSSVCKEDDVEDINNLSDDDCTESLEEFWKRARDQIRRNKARC